MDIGSPMGKDETENKSGHSISTFQVEWFTNPLCSAWIAKTDKPTAAKCVVCNSKPLNVAHMGVNALDAHAKRKKHKNKLPGSDNFDIQSMFSKLGQSSAILDESASVINGSTIQDSDVSVGSKQVIISGYTQKENSLNAEIIWCLRMVMNHDNYNSCSDLSKLFGRMFPDSVIAKTFTLGKTKSRYTMLYGIEPEFKEKLIYDVNASPFYSPTFDESMNSESCDAEVLKADINNDDAASSKAAALLKAAMQKEGVLQDLPKESPEKN